MGLTEHQPTHPLSLRADKGKYSQIVIPAEAGIQGLGASFDKLRTNELLVYLPLSPPSVRGLE